MSRRYDRSDGTTAPVGWESLLPRQWASLLYLIITPTGLFPKKGLESLTGLVYLSIPHLYPECPDFAGFIKKLGSPGELRFLTF